MPHIDIEDKATQGPGWCPRMSDRPPRLRAPEALGDTHPAYRGSPWTTRVMLDHVALAQDEQDFWPWRFPCRWATMGREGAARTARHLDRKSTRLNSSHLGISYAVF